MGDVQVIRQWINPLYLVDETINQVMTTFYANTDCPNIQLSNFFLEQKAGQILRIFNRLPWKKQYLPNKHSFHQSTNDKMLSTFFTLLTSTGFNTLVSTMLRMELSTVKIEPLCFMHKDYTLLHDTYEQEKGIVCYFDFTKDWNESAGGQLISVTKTEPLISTHVFNAAHIIQKKEDGQCFVKYVNSAAGKKKVYFVKVVLN